VLGVLVGFAIIAAVVLTGYVVGRTGIVGEHGTYVLSRMAFFVFAPCLLFTVLADSDVHVLFSSVLVVAGISAFAAAGIYVLIAGVIWRRPVAEVTVGALGSGYVNANNIGIPVATYVIGSAAFSAPVILLQLLVLAPIALTVLDVAARGKASIGRILTSPLKNPIIIGSALGVILAATGVVLPEAVMEPFRLVGAAAVPSMLLSFGIALHGQRPLDAGTDRRGVILATGIKLAVMPLIAFLVAHFAFGMDGRMLFGVVVLATLPAAQNVFTYAQRYDSGVVLARDIVLITTLGCLPVLLLIAALLAP
jgi:predicted permease